MLKLTPILLSVLLLLSASLESAMGAPVLEGARITSGPLEDCNRNGVEDSVDIAYGSSSDMDRNGVPDECESQGEPRPLFQGCGRIFLCDSNSDVGWSAESRSQAKTLASGGLCSSAPGLRAPFATL